MSNVTHHLKHHSLWTQEERDDVAEVIKTVTRDDTGITYEVCLTLRSLAAHAYEMGEDRCTVWSRRWDFGPRVGNMVLSLEQEAVAAAIAATVWPNPRAVL